MEDEANGLPNLRRLLFIVARGRAELLAHLQEQFADVAHHIEVVYDRRMTERRRLDRPVALDRRKHDRRRRDIRDQLLGMGWALVRRA